MITNIQTGRITMPDSPWFWHTWISKSDGSRKFLYAGTYTELRAKIEVES